MKILTRMKKAARLALCLSLLGAGVTGCIKDEYGGRGNATVTMTFTTQAAAPQAPTPSTEPATGNERMKTLRVIVARSATNEILYNKKYTIPEGTTSKTINYSELTVNENGEDFDFYAIANEASLNAGTSLEGKDVDLENLQSRKISMGVNTTTNGIALPATGLPQTDFMTVNVSPANNGQNYGMPLQFVVAKARITFLNTTKDVQTVSNLRLENVQPANATTHQTELFRDTELSTPAVTAAGSQSVNIGNVTDIPAGTEEEPGEKAVACYFYETIQGTDPYKLTATWEGTNYEIELDDHAIAAISRGQMLDIRVTLIKKEGLKVSWTVKDWEADHADGAEVEFTSQFNGSLTGQLVKTYATDGKQYVAVAEGQDSQQRERYAQFYFVMTSPVGATWTAHLTDGDNFEFVGPYSGTGVTQEEADENQGRVLLTVKPRHPFDNVTRTTRLYITVDGLEGAQLINVVPDDATERPFPGADTYIDIIQIGTAEYDNISGGSSQNP